MSALCFGKMILSNRFSIFVCFLLLCWLLYAPATTAYRNNNNNNKYNNNNNNNKNNNNNNSNSINND